MPTFSIPGPAGSLHVVDLREESPEPSGALPMVFVHGMVGHTGFWNPTLAACADRRRAVAVDLRGHGNSSAPANGDYSVAGCASDVLAVVDALALGPIVLVGHSYGTLATIEAAAERPDLVRRLILVDPPFDCSRVSDEIRNSQFLPFLQIFDLREHTVYGTIRVPGTMFAQTGSVGMATVWGYVGLAALYAVAFSTFALAAGLVSFGRRELGGAEG